MGLFHKLVKTYDSNINLVGKYTSGEKTVLAPIYHSIKKADIEISIDSNGKFKTAKKLDRDNSLTIFPVTEESQGRSGTSIRPHPLCDALGYFVLQNKDKLDVYLNNLKDWIDSDYTDPIIEAVFKYVSSNTILKDLKRCKLVELDKKNNATSEDLKLFIRWNIIDLVDSECWRNDSLFNKYIEYYRNKCNEKMQKGICMITGEETAIASQHPKACPNRYSNAKLISTNDESGFSYRGRFLNGNQAVSVGIEVSQKAHNALRWLIERQSVSAVFGNRIFLCWNPNGYNVCMATGPFKIASQVVKMPSDYKKQLSETLKGYMSTLPEKEEVIITAFDAATPGRMSMSYYNELMGSDFINRLYSWDLHCSWFNGKYGIQSPSLINIINVVYGNVVENNFKASDGIIKQQMQTLVSCRIDGYPIPRVYIEGVMHKISKLNLYDKERRNNLLFVACSVIRKYRFDKYKEEWEMEIDNNKLDISYQFGRLLAIFEKAELSTYTLDDQRETTALRLQNTFCQRPMYASGIIEKQLERAYFPKMKASSRNYFKNLISDVMNIISEFPESEWNKPLKETYVMGYYLQRKEFYKKNENKEEQVDD